MYNQDRKRAYCFTINNYNEETVAQVNELAKKSRYLIYGKEISKTGTKHLQGYIHFKTMQTFHATRLAFPKGTHIEVAQGTAQQNKAYCAKEGDFIEFGEIPKDKTLNIFCKQDWDDARELAKLGEFDKIPSKMYICHHAALHYIHRNYLQSVEPKRLNDTCGVWFWGVPKSGKSWTARENYPDHYIKSANKWWCGYRSQKNVIMDDISPEHCKYLAYYLKIWADIYPFTAETKGSSLFIRPEHVIITSNYSPEDCFPEQTELEAIRRRFKVVHFSTPFKK